MRRVRRKLKKKFIIKKRPLARVYRLAKKPIITTNRNLKFISRFYGFLFTTNTLLINFASKNRKRVSTIKKIFYYFSFKDDIRKYILQKYAKHRATAVNFRKNTKK
jgi:hypothetical protein